MPAINPDKLAKEVKQIQNLVGNPRELRWRVMELFEFYSDRTQRRSSSPTASHTEKQFRVPHPVTQAVKRGLKKSLTEFQEYRTDISNELWNTNYRETKILAIALLEDLPFEEILKYAETWSTETKDIEILTKLAKTLVSSWKEVNYSGFLSTSTKWLIDDHFHRKVFSLLVFHQVVLEPDFSDLPLIFRLLQDHKVAEFPELRKILHGLLRALAQRSAPETARFLLDILEQDNSLGRKLIKVLLECFPHDQQELLKRALST